MKITGAEILQVALPMRREHHTALGAAHKTAGSYPILKLRTDEGIVGLGDTSALKEWGGAHGTYFGESAATVMLVLRDYLMPAIEGQDPFRIEWIHTLQDRAIKGHPYAKAAVDIALYDIVGKALNTPVYQLLGGRYRDRVPIAQSLGFMPIERAVAEAAMAVEEGIKTIKVKIGQDPERDVAAVRAVREAIGPRVSLVVDANQAYATPKLAIRVLKQLEECDLLYAEQPVMGFEAMAAVAHALDTPIMADELAWTPQDVLRIIKMGAADFVSLYTTKPGGMFGAKQVAAVCEAGGIYCNVNGSGEMGIGTAANLHLAVSTKVVTMASVHPVTQVAENPLTKMAGRKYLDDVVTEPFPYEDGCVIVPNRPGLGVELDERKVAKYRVA